MNTMSSAVMDIVNTTLDWVTLAFEVSFARAFVFRVHIHGHLFVEGLLVVVIMFLLSQKSDKPPKWPLTKKEIDELCDEWVPESLIPPITKEMQYEPPALERYNCVFQAQWESLQSTLAKVTIENKRAQKLKRYTVVEAMYQNSGKIAPLDKIIQLKEKYRVSVLLDESNSFGVLGNPEALKLTTGQISRNSKKEKYCVRLVG